MESNKEVGTDAGEAGIHNLYIGTRVQLRTQCDTGGVEQFSTLIGLVRDEFLLVKSPVLRNTPFIYYAGEKIMVRAFTGTLIYGFSATVVRTFLSPFYYMHLSYPRDVTISALRSAMRFKTKLPAVLSYTDHEGVARSNPATLINLSVSGAAIESSVLLSMEQKMNFLFSVFIDGGERPIRTAAIVRSVTPRAVIKSQDEAQFSFGLQFKDMSAEDQTSIKLLTYEIMLNDRQSII